MSEVTERYELRGGPLDSLSHVITQVHCGLASFPEARSFQQRHVLLYQAIAVTFERLAYI